jgi:mono/diheme cytochrome c family protein
MNPSQQGRTRRTLRGALLGVALAASAVLGLGCGGEPHPFKEAQTFAGNIEVSAHDLNDGYEAYMLYCYACHGEKGDGKGPASWGLRPPPRDFRKAVFKFARVRSSDELPHDDDLFRIVRGGLHGTAMLPWDMPDMELDKAIQYIKTFAPDKWQKKKKSGELVKTLDTFEAAPDPWPGKVDEAVQRGKELYHLRAECMNCHPAYDTKSALYDMSVGAAKRDPENFKAIAGFREDVYGSVAKDAPAYEQKILPPDFVLHPIRSMCVSGTARCRTPGAEATKVQLEDLFRLISFGVYPVMPAWKGAGLSDADIWALSYYVKSLADLRDTTAGFELKQKLASQAPFQPPAAAPTEEKKPEAAPAEEAEKKPADKPAEKKPAAKPAEKKPAAPPAPAQP